MFCQVEVSAKVVLSLGKFNLFLTVKMMESVKELNSGMY
jgi:hypothetical protein